MNTPYVLIKHLHRELIDTTNAVGVDVNSLVNHRFRLGPLQFIGGLGPRKSEALRHKILTSGGLLRKREELITKEMLGACVFQNCAGFLLVNHLMERDMDVRSLGETRIHPENYQLAVKMAKNALDDEREGDEQDDEMSIEDVMRAENKHKLDQLDLEAYAEALAAEGQERKYTLYQIKDELQEPAKAPEWVSYKELKKEEIFMALTGETQKTLGSLRSPRG